MHLQIRLKLLLRIIFRHTLINLLIKLPTPKHHHQTLLLRARPKGIEVGVALLDGLLLEFSLHFVFGELCEGEAGVAAVVSHLGGVVGGGTAVRWGG